MNVAVEGHTFIKLNSKELQMKFDLIQANATTSQQNFMYHPSLTQIVVTLTSALHSTANNIIWCNIFFAKTQ